MVADALGRVGDIIRATVRNLTAADLTAPPKPHIAWLIWHLTGVQSIAGSASKGSRLISAAVSSANGCQYTLATAFAFGRKEGLSEDELAAAGDGKADDPKIAVALRFALHLVRKRGSVSRSEVKELRDAGWGDQEIVEIVALVALNIFRNYVNLAVGTELDFPSAWTDKFG